MGRSTSVLLTICLLLGLTSGTQAQGGLPGAWQVIEITDQAGTNNKPEPGLYIFTKRHYSIVEVQSRPGVGDAGGDLIRSQSGTYEASNGSIKFLALVARNPQAMQTGTQGAYTLADGVLTITTGKVVRKFKRLE